MEIIGVAPRPALQEERIKNPLLVRLADMERIQ